MKVVSYFCEKCSVRTEYEIKNYLHKEEDVYFLLKFTHKCNFRIKEKCIC